MDAGAVLGGERHGAQAVVGIVEEPPEPARGGEGGGVDGDAEEAEELVVVEGGGAAAPDAGKERRVWRGRSRARDGIGGGGLLGAHGGGKRGLR